MIETIYLTFQTGTADVDVQMGEAVGAMEYDMDKIFTHLSVFSLSLLLSSSKSSTGVSIWIHRRMQG